MDSSKLKGSGAFDAQNCFKFIETAFRFGQNDPQYLISRQYLNAEQ